MSIFGRKKVKASPDEVARTFLSDFVANNDLAPSTDLELTTDQKERYEFKCKLYRLALLIMILMDEERDNCRFLTVRESIESRTFSLPDEHSPDLLEDIRHSMSDLQALLLPREKPKELSWARSWFEAIDIDVLNPAELTLFAINWMDQYIAVTKSLRDFKIVL